MRWWASPRRTQRLACNDCSYVDVRGPVTARVVPSISDSRMKSSTALSPSRTPTPAAPLPAAVASLGVQAGSMSMAMCSRMTEQWMRWYSERVSDQGLGFMTEQRGSCSASASNSWSASLPYTQCCVTGSYSGCILRARMNATSLCCGFGGVPHGAYGRESDTSARVTLSQPRQPPHPHTYLALARHSMAREHHAQPSPRHISLPSSPSPSQLRLHQSQDTGL